MTPLDRLMAKADPLFKSPAFDEKHLPAGFKLGKTHRQLLQRRNGGYFFGSALHIFGACTEPTFHSLSQWNDVDYWKGGFDPEVHAFTFFAEDAFGDEFGLDASGKVYKLRAEQGLMEELADDFDQWLLMAVEAPDELLGRATLARWSSQHGHLPYGSQLQAYPPFLFADDPDTVMIEAVDALENMEFHAAIVQQIAAIPDGVSVKVEFTSEGMQITPTEPPPEGA